ncbi:MAG TPA: hypothetical protein PK801_00065 [Aggregatilineales bacterium]|nr:hypothetical protein [Chloroflexota bacterium]HOA23789.1 hypothetical protein [Aggregatilineales bacterium]HPV07016.1 hypothetical protein [Aggregatilineales bacterium]HQA66685.1 hypothetical protein [Aggregatilineales bacterium]HQE17867.1 hypothetical protein [Aggregatilineales bacterium]
MSHNFTWKDLERLAENDALEQHPAYAKVWRERRSGALIVTLVDDFFWFPDSYTFLGYIEQARRAHQALARGTAMPR